MKNEKIQKVKSWIAIAIKETANILTNLLVPIISVVVLIAEVIPFIPTSWVGILKKIEYWMFYAAGTATDIAAKAKEELEKKSE